MKCFLTFALIGTAFAAVLQKKSVSGTATVNLGSNIGTPQHLASGWIYGIPDTLNQIPDHFYTDVGFRYGRAGGAQVVAPGRGWIWGLTEYKSALHNYQTTRKHNGQFIFLIHDLWGADGTQNSSAPYPGDNGDWTSWDKYLTQWISDMKANGVITSVIIDIWNEPDLTYFWNRPQAQWLQMWGRTYYRIRKDLPTAQITGPSLAGLPSTSNTWWTNWASFVAGNKSNPDQHSWHMEGGGGDMESSVATYKTILANNGVAQKTININEYGTYAEQVPCGGAWWISQLERVGALGLRGNWLSTAALHDFAAGLLGKPNAGTSSYSATATGYWPAAEFQVYKYYATNMTGYRVATTPTGDRNGDVFAVVGSSKVRILVGARITTGTWYVQLNNLESVGLPASGTLNIQTWGFNGNANNHFQEYDSYTDLGVYGHAYSGGTVTFPIFQVDAVTTWAFEFAI